MTYDMQMFEIQVETEEKKSKFKRAMLNAKRLYIRRTSTHSFRGFEKGCRRRCMIRL